MNDLANKLEKNREEHATYRGRVQYIMGRLREAGFPEIAGRLQSGLLLLSGPGSGDKALDEVEGLLEVLEHGDGDSH